MLCTVDFIIDYPAWFCLETVITSALGEPDLEIVVILEKGCRLSLRERVAHWLGRHR